MGCCERAKFGVLEGLAVWQKLLWSLLRVSHPGMGIVLHMLNTSIEEAVTGGFPQVQASFVYTDSSRPARERYIVKPSLKSSDKNPKLHKLVGKYKVILMFL